MREHGGQILRELSLNSTQGLILPLLRVLAFITIYDYRLYSVATALGLQMGDYLVERVPSQANIPLT